MLEVLEGSDARVRELATLEAQFLGRCQTGKGRCGGVRDWLPAHARVEALELLHPGQMLEALVGNWEREAGQPRQAARISSEASPMRALSTCNTSRRRSFAKCLMPASVIWFASQISRILSSQGSPRVFMPSSVACPEVK